MESFEGLAKRGIPCVGHVGYLPVRDTWIGGPRSVGKSAREAKVVFDQVKAFENAGCIGVEMELVPSPVAAYITKNTGIMTISMGSGVGCDAQFLFSCDLLGMHDGHYPRHSKTYMNYLDSAKDAFQQYRKEVLDGTYPDESQSLTMEDDEHISFKKMLVGAPDPQDGSSV
jgi:3-methyl-2-oxobutanoate hydroxymethyltransferase